MSLGQIVGIISWTIQKYENVKKFVKEKYRKHRSRKIRNAVDNGDTRTIDDVVRSVKQNQRDRNDSR